MTLQASPTGVGVLNPQGLDKLRRAAKDNSPDAIKAASTQFEALFLGMVMKSMRDATPSDGPFDSEQSKMMTGMLDQQMSQALAARGVGLADVLARQLTPGKGLNPAAAVQPSPAAESGKPSKPGRLAAFAERFAGHARAAAEATGIPARFMLAQAALESGWGKREIRHADGSNSHNLFGVKAGAGWKGKVAEVMTTEYHDGVASKSVQRFRAYGSYAEAFADYASMMGNSPRYKHLVAAAGDEAAFARGLQRAGYATDPRYAEKLQQLMKQV